MKTISNRVNGLSKFCGAFKSREEVLPMDLLRIDAIH